MTLETHAEGGFGLTNGGVGSVWGVPGFGQTSLSYSQSEFRGFRGGQLNVEHQYISDSVSLSMAHQETFEDYLDLASLSGAPIPARSRRASLSVPLRNWGTVGVGYLALDADPDARFSGGIVNCEGLGRCLPVRGASARFNNLFYSVQFARQLSFQLTVFNDLLRSETGVSAGLYWYFGRGMNASVSARHQARGETYTATVQKNVPVEGTGAGWSMIAADGLQEYRQAELGYRGRYGTATAGWNRFGESRQSNMQLRGAVVAMAGGLHLSNPIHDSFAVVETGVEGIKVLHENRPQGYTNRRGQYFLPNLSSFDVNRIAIDPTDLPADAQAESTEISVLPIDRAGVLVRLPVTRKKAAQIKLVSHTGKPLPLGTRVSLVGQTETAVVGYGGLVYLENLTDINVVRARVDNKTCAAKFSYQNLKGGIPLLGPVKCKWASVR